MCEDEYGYKYPKINHDKCIKCNKCKLICAYQNDSNLFDSGEVYAAVTVDEEILMFSASGGIFTQLAENFIKQNGIVYGCSLEKENEKLIPKHIRVSELQELKKLQGSKYVQSDVDNIYTIVKKDLENNKKVLFSGTPCQIAALKNFIGKKNNDNLFTIDIICHGVPNKKMFQDYIEYFENKNKVKVTNFSFRDKTKGWGLQAKVEYISKNNKKECKLINSHFSSYYQLFLDSKIYRENCYSCKYAGKERIGDITIGDFWGIETEHREYLKCYNGEFDENKGISCILINNEKGKKLIADYNNNLKLKESKFEKVARHNKQLNYPSKEAKERKEILDIYLKEGYKGVESWYNKKIGVKKYLYCIWNNIPKSWKKN
ncbi:MAG: Coenzyme F420 hydrogenase/dehydrogenase, beta subunit C-terminal domain [Clostridia bacterium]|nr:Coenzyme F420 hydrogenase/dehydrogenase, beta subunit C-terminal domain [Clostridia bacterium]